MTVYKEPTFLAVLLVFGFSSSGLCCEPGEFKCDNGNCVKGQAKCTDQPFCSDGSDVRNCLEPKATPPPCQSHRFQCDNGQCINLNWLCDKRNDCGDNSDERACPTRGSSVLTQASVIGLSVAVVGLFAILVGIIFMVTCARRKLERERLERRRQIAERHHDMVGPYGGYMIGQGMPEPPPRYSSQPDLSVSSSSFSPYPLCEVPPPLYSPIDKPTVVQQTYNEPPPTYTSYPDLRSALVEGQMERSDSVLSQGLDNPGLDVQEESFEVVKTEEKPVQNLSSSRAHKESVLSRAGTCHDLSSSNNSSSTEMKTSLPKMDSTQAGIVEAYGALEPHSKVSNLKNQSNISTSRRSSANSLYEGLTSADRDLLKNIMMTVPSEVLARRGSSENTQSSIDLRPPRMVTGQYKSEPSVGPRNVSAETKPLPTNGISSEKMPDRIQAKSYSHLEMMVDRLPPLRHALSHDMRHISSSELNNPWNPESLHAIDFHSNLPACVSTPKQTGARKFVCTDIDISSDDNPDAAHTDITHRKYDVNYHQGTSNC